MKKAFWSWGDFLFGVLCGAATVFVMLAIWHAMCPLTPAYFKTQYEQTLKKEQARHAKAMGEEEGK